VAYDSIPYEGFGGGLTLTAQAEVAKNQNQALDLLNVTFTRLGAIRQRDGYAKYTATPGVNRYDSLFPFYKSDGTKQLLAGADTRLEALDSSGVVTSVMTGLVQGPWDFTRFGTPTAETAYTGNGIDTLRKWDGTSWSIPTASTGASASTLVAGTNMPKGAYLAVTGVDNRLVVSGFTTTTGGPNNLPTSPSHVYFSEPGLPESYLTNSYIQLRPGDGEKIMGMVAWGDYVFIFKETAFWVYYGTSTDSSGNPIFNVRPIQVGIGAVSSRAILAGTDGVYFMGRDGVYRTTGQAPEIVSSAIEPFFTNAPAPYFKSQALNQSALTKVSMAWYRNQLYLSVPTGASSTNDRVFVFDPKYKWWTLYDFKASYLVPMRVGAQEDLMFAYATGTNDIARHSSAYITDAGTPVSARWSSGWLDFGSPNMKTIREFVVWASGKFNTGMAVDYQALNSATPLDLVTSLDVWSDGTDVTDLWGDGSNARDRWSLGATAVSAMVRRAQRGTVFSLALQSYDGSPWEVQRMVLHLRNVRPPSVIHAD
jgi:hypothetical protein